MSTGKTDMIDRASAYGDGVFETIAIRDGGPRFWEAHVERLQMGCSRLGVQGPDAKALARALDAALRDCEADTAFATARLVVAAEDSLRGYSRSPKNQTKHAVHVFSANRLPRSHYFDGVTTRHCKMQLSLQPALAGVKSLNRLEQVLARAEWQDPDVFEGLLSDTEGRLICGTMSNVFVVLNSTVVTPALTRCGVAGVMRAQVVEWLRTSAIECEVRDIETSELAKAGECFLTNSQFGVVPVRRCGDAEWTVGPLTRKVQALAAANGVPECAP